MTRRQGEGSRRTRSRAGGPTALEAFVARPPFLRSADHVPGRRRARLPVAAMRVVGTIMVLTFQNGCGPAFDAATIPSPVAFVLMQTNGADGETEIVLT